MAKRKPPRKKRQRHRDNAEAYWRSYGLEKVPNCVHCGQRGNAKVEGQWLCIQHTQHLFAARATKEKRADVVSALTKMATMINSNPDIGIAEIDELWWSAFKATLALVYLSEIWK